MARQHKLPSILGVSAIVLLTVGCASPAPEPVKPEQLTPPQPEELNIPAPPAVECDCDTDPAVLVENYFDRGVRALAARDYARARVYFERHRESGGDQATHEASVGIAFVTLLDESNAITGEGEGASGVDERAEVMILALAAVETLENQIKSIEQLNQSLTVDLEKREEALKLLRDLTLGAPEG